jgi:hypothetical protein
VCPDVHDAEYAVRTERNVLESDATLIICRGSPIGGTALTLWLAQRHGKPHLMIGLDRSSPANARRWLTTVRPATRNVAGPRESTAPGIASHARDFLMRVLS